MKAFNTFCRKLNTVLNSISAVRWAELTAIYWIALNAAATLLTGRTSTFIMAMAGIVVFCLLLRRDREAKAAAKATAARGSAKTWTSADRDYKQAA